MGAPETVIPPPIDGVVFGAMIRAFRERKNLSQTTFGAQVGLFQSDLSAVETGRKNADLMLFAKLARAMEIEPARMFDAISIATVRVMEAGQALGLVRLTPDQARPLAALLFGPNPFGGAL